MLVICYRHTSFYCVAFYYALEILLFLFPQIKDLWQPCVEQSIGTIYHFFNSICLLQISVSHFGNSHSISDFFIINIFGYGDLWSVIFDVATAERLQVAKGSDDYQFWEIRF